MRVNLPKRYEVVDLGHFSAAVSCKRIIFAASTQHRSHIDPDPMSDCENSEDCGRIIQVEDLLGFLQQKLQPMGMTAVQRGDAIFLVEGDAKQPGPEPSEPDRINLDPNAPHRVTSASPDETAAAASSPLLKHIACMGSQCRIDKAGIAALVNGPSLRLRPLPISASPGSLKLFGISPQSLYAAIGLSNATTLIAIDGAPACDIAGDDAAKGLAAFFENLLRMGGTAKLQFAPRGGDPRWLELIVG